MALHPRGAGSPVAGDTDLHTLGTRRGVEAIARPPAGARRRARHGLPRRQPPADSPEDGRRGKKAGSATKRNAREALGRSHGGYGTKACVIGDKTGCAVAVRLTPGQAHELPHATPLLDFMTLCQ